MRPPELGCTGTATETSWALPDYSCTGISNNVREVPCGWDWACSPGGLADDDVDGI